ncbi:ENTH domain-containing protein [Coprinopsis sp. MPI-PUGE-AT-0042]|nr:ENTH domain-containing protein [Coprinopsis sp. MPI-PUGE-AT-0042]
MSSFDKIVKLACKPKAASPKAKYMDPIIAATWSDDGAVSDVCKALIPRIREPNHIVVFKALIVLHTMIRNGSTDNVLSYLSQADTLRLKNISTASWEGYNAPENLQHYATYLDARIRAYGALKHDAIRVQSDTNRDMRNSVSVDEELGRNKKSRNQDAPSSMQRSKTLAGRKLRSMTVEKGLLRETKIVHSMIDSLVECRFYLDDLEDELNIGALRMLVKDLLILFQAGNEGVINVLEHYFEMSHVDAEEALKLYRHFCSQTEKVVEFLGVAKKLQNLLNVPIPNLKHAPVSLAGALQEYLDDPNFEDNRLEYKSNKKASDKASKRPAGKEGKQTASITFSDTSATSNVSKDGSSSSSNSAPNGQKDVIDFFAAIESEQQPMFPSSPPNSAGFPGPGNPFSQMAGPQFTGVPQVMTQPTGFMMPQHTVTPANVNPFGQFLSPQAQQSASLGSRPMSAFIPQQQTGFPQQNAFLQPQQTAFLQPQSTGMNPFRQSMLLPQSTGMALFANTQPTGNQAPSFGQGPSLGQNLFAQNTGMFASPQSNGPSFNNNSSIFSQPVPAPSGIAASTSAFTPSPSHTTVKDVPNRPASTPLTSMTNSFAPAQPVKTHQTGTKNPFGPVITAPPPVPKVPTLMDLAMGQQMGQSAGSNGQPANGQPQQQPAAQPQQPQQTGAFNWGGSALSPGATDISSIASSFTKVGQTPFNNTTTSPTSAPSTSSPFSSSAPFSSTLTSQPTGATPLTSQATGFAGLKPFKPSSSFGASLLESLPNVNGTNSQPTGTSSTPSAGNPSSLAPNPTGFPSFSITQSQSTPFAFGASLMQNTGNNSSLGVGLRPQITGGGSANPFRASMATGDGQMFGSGSAPPVPGLPSHLTGMPFGQQQQQQTVQWSDPILVRVQCEPKPTAKLYCVPHLICVIPDTYASSPKCSLSCRILTFLSLIEFLWISFGTLPRPVVLLFLDTFLSSYLQPPLLTIARHTLMFPV